MKEINKTKNEVSIENIRLETAKILRDVAYHGSILDKKPKVTMKSFITKKASQFSLITSNSFFNEDNQNNDDHKEKNKINKENENENEFPDYYDFEQDEEEEEDNEEDYGDDEKSIHDNDDNEENEQNELLSTLNNTYNDNEKDYNDIDTTNNKDNTQKSLTLSINDEINHTKIDNNSIKEVTIQSIGSSNMLDFLSGSFETQNNNNHNDTNKLIKTKLSNEIKHSINQINVDKLSQLDNNFGLLSGGFSGINHNFNVNKNLNNNHTEDLLEKLLEDDNDIEDDNKDKDIIINQNTYYSKENLLDHLSTNLSDNNTDEEKVEEEEEEEEKGEENTDDESTNGSGNNEDIINDLNKKNIKEYYLNDNKNKRINNQFIDTEAQLSDEEGNFIDEDYEIDGDFLDEEIEGLIDTNNNINDNDDKYETMKLHVKRTIEEDIQDVDKLLKDVTDGTLRKRSKLNDKGFGGFELYDSDEENDILLAQIYKKTYNLNNENNEDDIKSMNNYKQNPDTLAFAKTFDDDCDDQSGILSSSDNELEIDNNGNSIPLKITKSFLDKTVAMSIPNMIRKNSSSSVTSSNSSKSIIINDSPISSNFNINNSNSLFSPKINNNNNNRSFSKTKSLTRMNSIISIKSQECLRILNKKSLKKPSSIK